MSDASPPEVPPPYTRPHDPKLCDYLVFEGGEGVETRALRLELFSEPPAADGFDDEPTGQGWAHTMMGPAAAARPPAKR